ncbi:MAG: oxidoreductase [Acidimicrobiaceae bacterium]|nr:oxidoreductase [Acidimicrobiaceae bacterium]
MNDVTGMPASAVVLGGGSDLARAVLARLAPRRLERVVLAGRDALALAPVADELRALGVDSVEIVHFDAREVAKHKELAAECFKMLGEVDLVLVAAGALIEGALAELDPAEVAAGIETNFSGPAAAVLAFAQLMARQGQGRIVVFSSVAGMRVRRANFAYGAAKAGLDGFCQGLGDALAGSGVRVSVVRPGFVATKMTAGMKPQPFAATAAKVGDAVVRSLETGAEISYVPGFLGPIFVLLRLLPRAVWRRMPS